MDQIGSFLLEQNLAKDQIPTFRLQEFDTELDFCAQIGYVISKVTNNVNSTILFSTICRAVFKTKSNDPHLMILQCDSGHLDGELIACAKYRIMDEYIKNEGSQTLAITHVLVIIHLPMQAKLSSFVGFHGGSWTSVHIDELMPDNDLNEVSPEEMTLNTISELFCTSTTHQTQPPEPQKERQDTALNVSYPKHYWLLRKCIQAAVSHLEDGDGSRRGLDRISILEALLPDGTGQTRK